MVRVLLASVYLAIYKPAGNAFISKIAVLPVTCAVAITLPVMSARITMPLLSALPLTPMVSMPFTGLGNAITLNEALPSASAMPTVASVVNGIVTQAESAAAPQLSRTCA